jgi:hypothetical protein
VFPRGSFAPSDRFGGAEALQASDDPVARRLLDQLGKGVFAAVKAKYARTITYYVVGPPSVAAKGERGGDENGADFSEKGDSFEDADDETERVLEEYAFTIRYGDETSPADAAAAGPAGDVFENVSVRATTKTSRRLDASVSGGRERGVRASSSLDDEEKIKDAGDQMLRQLEALIEHLDPVPVGSRIGIRLTYVDATPPEYEPPFFESVEPSGNAEHGLKFRGEQTECGSVETRFHALSLRWTGLAGADQDLAEDGAADLEANLPLDAKRKASALFPFPFESQPEPEPEPVVECRDYHYLSQSEPQLDSESQGLGAARGPARSPPRIGWADGFAGGPPTGARQPGPGPGPGSRSRLLAHRLASALARAVVPVHARGRWLARRGTQSRRQRRQLLVRGRRERRREPGVARRERLARVRRVRRVRRRRVRLAHPPRERRRGGWRDGEARGRVPHPPVHAVAEAAPLGRRGGHLRRRSAVRRARRGETTRRETTRRETTRHFVMRRRCVSLTRHFALSHMLKRCFHRFPFSLTKT